MIVDAYAKVRSAFHEKGEKRGWDGIVISPLITCRIIWLAASEGRGLDDSV